MHKHLNVDFISQHLSCKLSRSEGQMLIASGPNQTLTRGYQDVQSVCLGVLLLARESTLGHPGSGSRFDTYCMIIATSLGYCSDLDCGDRLQDRTGLGGSPNNRSHLICVPYYPFSHFLTLLSIAKFLPFSVLVYSQTNSTLIPALLRLYPNLVYHLMLLLGPSLPYTVSQMGLLRHHWPCRTLLP